MFRTRKPRKFPTWTSLFADSRQKRFPSRWTMRNFASARWGFLLNFIGTTLRNSNALCPVRPPQTAIGRPAGTLLGSAPVPVAVSGVAPKTVSQTEWFHVLPHPNPLPTERAFTFPRSEETRV